MANWDVEIGLVEGSGQWWKGSWSKEDIIHHVEKPATETAVEKLAERISNLITSGELSIKGWSDGCMPEDIQLKIGSDIGIDLHKLPNDESLTRAMERLKKIALQAQLHNCQLFKTTPSGTIIANNEEIGIAASSSNVNVTQVSEEKEQELEEAQNRIKELEKQMSIVKQIIIKDADSSPKRPAPKPPRGASRANPTRQKRKITEAEFESD
ncbi:hypothetical protein Clacol_002348 [Clathrus columnatus]|uniref:Uncharacterized protein n=1 Tax=Clathrus columnatus TaxID=1419009 RepID=A0AAV5A8A8_9AGAM|nr:hypothetical protein Clacol_002348 [Clathrus columnatus]